MPYECLSFHENSVKLSSFNPNNIRFGSRYNFIEVTIDTSSFCFLLSQKRKVLRSAFVPYGITLQSSKYREVKTNRCGFLF